MTKWTHIDQMNGYSRGPLIDSVRPFPDQIKFALNRMNGASFWAWSLWRAPEDADLLEDIPLSDEYMQCAGSSEAMTLEVRTLDKDGIGHQFVIGKPEDNQGEEPTEVIAWDENKYSTTVYKNEVFTADEAAEVFYSYFLTNEVIEPYTLRELDLSKPAEEGKLFKKSDGELSAFIQAVGHDMYSPDHQKIIALAGPEMEIDEDERNGMKAQYQYFTNSGVTLQFKMGLLVVAMIELVSDDGNSYYHSSEKLINDLPLPASRDDVRIRFGKPNKSEEKMDLFIINNRYVRFDFADDKSTNVTVILYKDVTNEDTSSYSA